MLFFSQVSTERGIDEPWIRARQMKNSQPMERKMYTRYIQNFLRQFTLGFMGLRATIPYQT